VNDTTIGVILNPASAAGKTIKLLPVVVASLEHSGRRFDIHVTSRAGEAPGVVGEMAARGCAIVVAIGGDGTINEVASGIVRSGARVVLGLVPSGHGSDLVRTLSIPSDPDRAMERVYAGQIKTIDVGQATFDSGEVRYFLNVAGLGFDSIVAETMVGTKLPGSTLPYIVGLVKAMRLYKNTPVRVEGEHGNYVGPALSVIVANARYFGGGMQIAPMADMQDGLLDAAVLGDISKADLIRQVPRVYRGKHIDHPKFHHVPAKSLRVTAERPLRVQLDGELGPATPVTFSVIPGGIDIVV
jgi:diacylglycerol kinase (ATP)